MTNLNLTASGKPQELILAYLQENASDVLAEKINNGTPIEKDDKQLINKKTLNTFMQFAESEAKKLAEKSAHSACVEDSVVFGWAVHYFEEDSIEGVLYNPDGTEYKPVVKTAPKPVTTPATAKPKETNTQTSLWDMLEAEARKADPLSAPELIEVETNNEENITEFDPSVDEIADKLQQALDEKNGITPQQLKTIQTDGKVIDVETGVVLSDSFAQKHDEHKNIDRLFNLLEGKIYIA